MSALKLSNAESVRIVVVAEGATYEVELSSAAATFAFEQATATRYDGGWPDEEPTGFATVELKAFGKIVNSERRPS